MARFRPTYDPNKTLLELLTPDELRLNGYPGDRYGVAWEEVADFRANALEMFGTPGWIEHVPNPRDSTLNGMMRYLTGEVLWGYQLVPIYCPIREIQILGARGTGKTMWFGLVGGLWTAMNPGNNWLHTAPSKDQAEKAFSDLIGAGMRGYHEGRSLVDLFIANVIWAPHAEITFRSWDKYDPGSLASARSTGKPNEPGELLRSFEVGLHTFDEAFRTFMSAWAKNVLGGCLRGLNEWRANQRPDLKAQWQDTAIEQTMTEDLDERERLEIANDEFAQRNGLAKNTWAIAGGNAGWHGWPYRIQRKAERNGFREVYAVTWETHWNPAFTRTQRKELERKYKDDPDTLEMELYAKRPPPPGQIYVADQVELLFDPSLDDELIKRVTSPDSDENIYIAGEEGEERWGVSGEREGYVYRTHEDHGVYQFAFPYIEGHQYAGGADAGTRRVPERNKWVIMIADITDKPPYPIVYFETGNVTARGMGSIMPWLTRLNDLCSRDGTYYYPMMPGSLYVDATGIQKWIHEVSLTWDQPIQIYPFSMQQKGSLILKSQLMLSKGIFRSPTVEMWESELGIYDLPDNPPMPQDIVMAFLALCQVVWDFRADGLGLYWDDEMTERAEEAYQYRIVSGAATRLTGRQREVRNARV